MPACACAPRHTQHPPGTQAGRQIAAQRATTLNEQSLIDGFMADAHGLIVREVDRQAASNLLRAPGVCPPSILPRSMPAAFPAHSRAGNRSPTPSDDEPCQSFLHIGSQCRVERKLRLLWTASRSIGMPLRCRRAITPSRRFGLQRCAATPAKSLKLFVRAGAQPLSWSSPALEEVRSPPAPQMRDTGRTAASLMTETSLVACRLPFGTISFLQPATYPLGAQHLHSPFLPRSPPRTAVGHLVLPPPGDLVRTMAPDQTDP